MIHERLLVLARDHLIVDPVDSGIRRYRARFCNQSSLANSKLTRYLLFVSCRLLPAA